MLSAKEDDVSNIHRRWSFTRLTPSSLRASYVMTFVCAFAVISTSHVFHLGTNTIEFAIHLPLGLGAVFAIVLLDSLMLRGAPVNKLTKVVHVSSFSNLLWAMTVLTGILANAMFAKSSMDYVVAGMMLAAGLRIGIFTSVFGASLARAIAVCMIMPLVLFLAFVPPGSWFILSNPTGLGFGLVFLALAISWSAIADRAGRPHVQSTFRLLQAFLSSWTENKSSSIEDMFEARASEQSVSTAVIKLASTTGNTVLVLPEVHPGPFGQAGGSNLPYVLFKRFDGRALVMHGVSGHSLNIPSKRELDRYMEGLEKLAKKDSGNTARDPIQVRQGNATATCIAFGRTALVMLSLAPKGMEDVPENVRKDLELYAAGIGFNILVADCHNAMGRVMDEKDREDLVAAARKCLDKLYGSLQHEFSVGFASLDDVSHELGRSVELGQSGLAVVVLKIGSSEYAIGWADANNMENTLRDKITLSVVGVKMLEVCTSDTHATSGKRTREGYFALGTVSNHDAITDAFAAMCAVASKRLEPCTFETSLVSTNVKVMGKKQFEDYSSALDRSMTITKAFVGVTFAAFIALQVLAS